jgi:hypothetical protein
MNLEHANRFIWENARLLERAIFELHFNDGEAERLLAILKTYQNPDGGFGQALEPDLRAPGSQPLYTEFALHTLYEANLRDPQLAWEACNFVARHADLQRGIPAIFAGARQFPHAAHWDSPTADQPAPDRLVSLVGLLHWQGIRHPWLSQAVESSLKYLAASRLDDAHTLANAFCLLESLPADHRTEALFTRLSEALPAARFYCAYAPISGYALTPLDFAPTPSAYCRQLFTTAQIEAHLDDLASQQDQDGGWPIQWEPPPGSAAMEWRARKTVNSLHTLRAYGRI